ALVDGRLRSRLSSSARSRGVKKGSNSLTSLGVGEAVMALDVGGLLTQEAHFLGGDAEGDRHLLEVGHVDLLQHRLGKRGGNLFHAVREERSFSLANVANGFDGSR